MDFPRLAQTYLKVHLSSDRRKGYNGAHPFLLSIFTLLLIDLEVLALEGRIK